MHGFSGGEAATILEIIEANSEEFKLKWNEYFGK